MVVFSFVLAFWGRQGRPLIQTAADGGMFLVTSCWGAVGRCSFFFSLVWVPSGSRM